MSATERNIPVNATRVGRTADKLADHVRTGQAVSAVHVRDAVTEVDDVLATLPPAEPGHRRGTRDSE
jgi:hypothetical protein